MILIISQTSDTHATIVEKKLRERGANVVLFDHAEYPKDAEISLEYSPARGFRRTIRGTARTIPLDEVTAAWHRRPRAPAIDPRITDPASASYAAAESKEFLIDLWDSLTCLRVPAPLPVYRRAEHKASQLVVAAELGFQLPPTLFTNSPSEFLDFYRAHDGKVISKMPSAVFHRDVFGRDFTRFTEVVSHRDLGYFSAVRYSPMIFQAYVEKKVELRITVVGGRVFAAEIDSQATNHTKYDWRKYDHGRTPYSIHELPAPIAARCVALVKRLGLCYGTIDLILTPDDRYIFLEINPNGQFQWIEDKTGLPISDAICDLLLSGTIGAAA